MEFSEMQILVRLLVGAFATFCAILLWARSRDLAWILMVVGVLIIYAEIILSTLLGFGLLRWEEVRLWGLPALQLIRMVLSNLPILLFALAFIVALRRTRV